MKNSLKILAFLPIMLLGGCNSDDATYELEKDLNLTLDLALDKLTRAELTSDDPETSMNVGRLYFATYGSDYTRIHYVYGDGTAQTGITANYYKGSLGPSLNFTLPKTSYNSDFWICAFSVPAYAKSTFEPTDFSSASDFVLTWPGNSTGNYLWSPALDEDNFIPMAGKTKVDLTNLLAHYNDEIAAMSPYRLDAMEMTRAMAKVEIIDVDADLTEVSLKTPTKGMLFPDLDGWLVNAEAYPNVPASGVSTVEQKMGVSGASSSTEGKHFVFYTYESSFLEYNADGTVKGIKAADNDDRKLIHLKSSKYGQTDVRFAVYSPAGPIDMGKDLMTENNGAWRGVMRNHHYKFYVHAPSNGDIQIYVTATKWQYERHNFNF